MEETEHMVTVMYKMSKFKMRLYFIQTQV